MDPLTGIGLGMWFAALLARAIGRLRQHEVCGIYAICSVLFSVDAIRAGDQFGAVLNAAVGAFMAYCWWTGGGAMACAAACASCAASSKASVAPHHSSPDQLINVLTTRP